MINYVLAHCENKRSVPRRAVDGQRVSMSLLQRYVPNLLILPLTVLQFSSTELQ